MYIPVAIYKTLPYLTCARSPHSHRLYGLMRHDMEHETSDASLSF